MRIQVNRIPKEGLRLETTYDPLTLHMAREDAHPAAPIGLSAWVTKNDDELMVDAALRCVLECTCARCLICFESVIKKACLLHYDVRTRLVVDITDDVRQEIMLDIR